MNYTTPPYPMLARDWDTVHAPDPAIVQPKCNGIRMMLAPDGRCFGRTGRELRIASAKFGAYDQWLDGEIVGKDMNLHKIIGLCNQREWTDAHNQLQYVVFDLIDLKLNQTERLNKLVELSKQYTPAPNIRVLNTEMLTALQALECFNNVHTVSSLDGIIYRHPKGMYTAGRSWALLKRKRREMEEYLCTGVVEGLGKFYGMLGAFVLQLPTGARFNCGGGNLKVKDRIAYWRNPPLGKYITVEFPYKSNDNIPQCGQFVAVRPEYDY